MFATELPQLSTTKFTELHLMRIRKVAAYIEKYLKVGSDGSEFEGEALHLEVLCNRVCLTATMGLGIVQKWRWWSPQNLTLTFRLKGLAKIDGWRRFNFFRVDGGVFY